MTARFNHDDKNISPIANAETDVAGALIRQGLVPRILANLKRRLTRSITQWPIAVIALHVLLTVAWIATLIWLSISLITTSIHAMVTGGGP